MSAVPVKSPEPSMDEILASIRRIISDDQAESGTRRGGPPADGAAQPEAGPEPDGGDVLDLAELDAPVAVPAPAEEPAPVEAQTPVEAHAPEPAPAVSDVPAPDLAANDLEFRPVAAPEPAVDPAPTPVPAPPMPSSRPLSVVVREEADAASRDPRQSLLSPETTESVGQAFDALSQTLFSRNARTIDDVVQDLLRPMLQEWLDANLGPMVERLVRTEIERVVRRGR